MRASKSIKPRLSQERALDFDDVEVQAIFLAQTNCLLHHPKLSVLEFAQGLVHFCQFLQRRCVKGERPFDSRDDLRLFLHERGCGFFASSLGLSDGSLVSIEDGKSGRESDHEEVVSFLVRVPRSDLEIWVLFGNL